MSKQEQEQLLIVEKYVDKKSREFTVNDASSVTGLPLLETEYAVKQLMEKYDCKLKVTENGDLIYDFGQMQRRTARSFAERFQSFLNLFWNGFKIFYRIAISAFLVVYFVVFLLLVIALILGIFSSNNDSGSKGAGKLIGAVFRIFWSIFEWSTILGYESTYRRRDRYGYPYNHYVEKPGILGSMRKKNKDSQSKKGFVASVYDYVFGPPRIEADPLANQQEVATFLRENKGLINTYELQALAGWTRPEAENFMTQVLASYDGKAEISSEGMLYGDFSEFIRSKNRKGEAPVIYYWDEYEPAYELTGNKNWRDIGVSSMNLFNLLLASTVIWGPLGAILNAGTAVTVALGWIPLIYSLIFFLIPALRWLIIQPLRKKQHQTNVRKRVLKAIFEKHRSEISLKELTTIANQKTTTEEKLKEKEVEKIMLEVIQDMEGEASVDEKGAIVYKFERLAREWEDMRRLRSEKREDSNLGDVIFEA